MTDLAATLRLAQTEQKRYGFTAAYREEPALPSFEVRIVRGAIEIAAPNALEYLYGVYDCAERFFGWDFFEPGNDAFHPELVRPLPPDGVAVPAVKPRLKHCGFIQEFPFDDNAEAVFDWMAKNKLNYLMVWMTFYDGLSQERKEFAAVRGIIIESGHHNFNYLIPPERYRDTHPEFFAKKAELGTNLAGMPVSEGQLCTTNPELRKELVKNLLAYRRAHPELRYLALNPNDGFGWCRCPECSKLYDPNRKGDTYSRSEKHYRAEKIFAQLIEAVSAGVHAEAPDTVLNFFAYVNYCAPAPGFKLRPGMGVHLALYWRCVNHEITDGECGINSGYYRDILAWEAAKAGGLFNIYEYYMGINFNLSLPMIHWEEMFHEFDFYAAHGVDGVFTQFSPEHWSVYGPNYLMMARAARGENETEALDGFFRRRFGAMEPVARSFYADVRAMLHDMSDCHIPHSIAFLSRVDAARLDALVPAAKKLSAACPLLPGRALETWVEYMRRFKHMYDAAKSVPTPPDAVRELLAWTLGQRELKLFYESKFKTFFDAWVEDIARYGDWHYFTENDWFTEYDRHRALRRIAKD